MAENMRAAQQFCIDAIEPHLQPFLMQVAFPRVLAAVPLFALPFLGVAPALLGKDADSSKEASSAAVQIDVKEVLNARVITVVKDGVVVPLHDDIDGAGGLATNAASQLLGNKNSHPLPDDATFAATERHPRVVLSYANNGNITQNQARRSMGEDTFDFPVPAGNYAHFDLFFTSGWGASKIIVKLFYNDHSVERRDLEVPDWFWDLKPDDSYRSYLVDNLGKWDKKNKMVEENHHAIFSLDITPSPEKVLTKVAVHKMAGGLMVFYGATGTLAPKKN
jgi:hypothetical protein